MSYVLFLTPLVSNQGDPLRAQLILEAFPVDSEGQCPRLRMAFFRTMPSRERLPTGSSPSIRTSRGHTGAVASVR